MTTRPGEPAPAPRYGPPSFVATLVTMLIVQTLSWALFPYFVIALPIFGLVSAVVLPAGWFLSRTRAGFAQAGRGMLIGYLATPLSIAVVAGAIFAGTEITQLLE